MGQAVPRVGWLLVPLLAWLLHAFSPAAARAAEAPWEQLLAALAAQDPKARAEAAQKAGAAWPEGARMAPVLAQLLVDDPDPSVRSASAAALSALAAQSLGAWLAFLEGPVAAKPGPFAQVAEEVTLLGEKIHAVDFAAGLGFDAKDAPQAAVLGAMPLMWSARTLHTGQDRVTLELMLLERAARGGPATKRLALAALPLLSCAALRDAGRTGPQAVAGASPAGRLKALLSDPRPFVRGLALSLLGSAAAPTPDVVEVLVAHAQAVAAAPDDPEWASEQDAVALAVRRLGPAAQAAAPVLRALRKRGARGVIQAQVRIGVTEGLYRENPESIERYVRNRPEDAVEHAEDLHEFLDVVTALLDTDPGRAAEAKPALTALLLGPGTQPRYGPGGARLGVQVLRLLPRMGPLEEGTRRWLTGFAASPDDPLSRESAVALGLAGHEAPARLAEALLQLRGGGPAGLGPPFDLLDLLPERVRGLAAQTARQGALPDGVREEADPAAPAVRGALEGLALAPDRAAAAAPWIVTVLLRTLPRVRALEDGTFLSALVGRLDAPPEPAATTLADALEARRLALRALQAAGAASSAAKEALGLLLRDVDVDLRWRAHRLLTR